MSGHTKIHKSYMKPETPPPLSAKELREARTEMGLTRAEAARQVLVNYRTWQNWERGERPVPSYVRILLEYLRIKHGLND